jgi:hypothetical protein
MAAEDTKTAKETRVYDELEWFELCLLTETDVTCFEDRWTGVFINWYWFNMLQKQMN